MILRLFIGIVCLMMWTGSGLATETASVSRTRQPFPIRIMHWQRARRSASTGSVLRTCSTFQCGTTARSAGLFPSGLTGKFRCRLSTMCRRPASRPINCAAVLLKKLAEYVPSPEVSVIVREVHSFKVSVIGEVKKTGRHELKGRATVLDILAMAEGFGEFAGRGRIVVLRPEGKTMRQIPFNYNKVMSSNGALENFFLQPGDIIVVP